MAENFAQAYEDLVYNTTLLEKHMRDMQVGLICVLLWVDGTAAASN